MVLNRNAAAKARQLRASWPPPGNLARNPGQPARPSCPKPAFGTYPDRSQRHKVILKRKGKARRAMIEHNPRDAKLVFI